MCSLTLPRLEIKPIEYQQYALITLNFSFSLYYCHAVIAHLAQSVLKEILWFHYILLFFSWAFHICLFFFFPACHQTQKTSLFPEGAVIQRYTTVSIHLKFNAAVKEKLLWFSKYVCTSSVVSIKGMWADIKACSWIIYPWQLDCTFHLKWEAEFQCRKKWDSKPFSGFWLRWAILFFIFLRFGGIFAIIKGSHFSFFFLIWKWLLKHLLLRATRM